jgi:hypothetical protein
MILGTLGVFASLGLGIRTLVRRGRGVARLEPT